MSEFLAGKRKKEVLPDSLVFGRPNLFAAESGCIFTRGGLVPICLCKWPVHSDCGSTSTDQPLSPQSYSNQHERTSSKQNQMSWNVECFMPFSQGCTKLWLCSGLNLGMFYPPGEESNGRSSYREDLAPLVQNGENLTQWCKASPQERDQWCHTSVSYSDLWVTSSTWDMQENGSGDEGSRLKLD